MEVKSLLTKWLEEVLWKLGVKSKGWGVERPTEAGHGDWASNVALVSWGQLRDEQKEVFVSPRDLAERIGEQLKKMVNRKVIEKVEVAGGGFVNFYVSDQYLLTEVERVLQEKDDYGKSDWGRGRKVFVEYTDPNPFKEFHIGHLMSNTVGESLARLLEAGGWQVKRANYQGDVGMHVAKALWGMRKMMEDEEVSWQEVKQWSLRKRVKWMGQAYAVGARVYKEDEEAREEMKRLNKAVYEKAEEVWEMYSLGREWSLAYFETIYKRLGTKFDEYFFESESAEMGLKVVEEGLRKGVLEESEGAVVFRGEKVGLHTRVFRNALGLPTYEAKDLGLALLKRKRWAYDQSIIVTANEVDEYFKVVLAVLERLYPDLAEKTKHVSHGVMKLPTGKMSSRTGQVVAGEDLLNDLQAAVMAKMAASGQVDEKRADVIGVGALKYAVLKQDRRQDIVYEKEKLLSLEGNSGPYLEYTYARGRSVVRKVGGGVGKVRKEKGLDEEERKVVEWLVRYGEVVEEAGRKLAPHKVASFLYELASRYNQFYNQCRIVGDEREGVRVAITAAVTEVLRNGLGVLGIGVVERM